MATRRVIDFRVRPPYKSGLKFFGDVDAINESIGHGFASSKSEREKSVEALVEELDEAGVEKAVLPGRILFGEQTEDLFELADKYPGRFIVFPFINPLEGDKALAEVDKYVINGKGEGVAIEPGFQPETYWFDDERAFPLYQKLEENDIPLLITFSAAALPSVDSNAVLYLENVAKKYPKLKLVIAHAAWPFTKEIISVAFKYKNVYLIPDAYGLEAPGADDYIDAANTFIPNQLVYGSSYPVLPIVEAKEAYENRPFKSEEIKNKYFYENAAGILKLNK